MTHNPPDSDWSVVDAHLFAGERLLALQELAARAQLPLETALLRLRDRYIFLRATRADGFALGPDGYWDGFYS
ncbi:MAG: hypothetical protein LC118_20275 [Dehalococcoidia bacterium]|nr:hypothetical protein [Dehalococcoidia bacterium]